MAGRWWMTHAVICSCFSILLVGCSSSSPDPNVVPVSGKVLIDGTPKRYVRVTLIPANSSDLTPVATAMTDEEGEFHLTSHVVITTNDKKTKIKELDGVEPGDYFVAFSYLKPIRPNGSEPEFGDELLPAKYQTPIQSGLAELKVTIKSEQTDLPPFELKRR